MLLLFPPADRRPPIRLRVNALPPTRRRRSWRPQRSPTTCSGPPAHHPAVLHRHCQGLPEPDDDWVQADLWEHGRRNFSLRADGLLPIVRQIADGTDTCGVGVLTVHPAAAAEIMDADPRVRAGRLSLRAAPVPEFPG